ncbi:hypothetical protein AN218_22600 [Streptomyces nanshensis]|uniref:ATP-dependent DNA ligase family profile domain-containing protein n=1 Tax=Streptomyces nanshensis TaxID=518642 RepID=A0A1E7KZN6_9ACTN|nr:hypothetical protein AN218_22600 [Streptomyces nanshensis]
MSAEPKWDGWRLLIFRTEREVYLQTRSRRLVTDLFPDLAHAAAALPAGCVLDGEAVVFTGGRTDFESVQRRGLSGRTRAAVLARKRPANFIAFDLLAEGGEATQDLRTRPYAERRDRLLHLLTPLGPPLQPTPATGQRQVAERWFEEMRSVGVEGLVLKRTASRYRPGRTSDWQKIRHAVRHDAAVIGVLGNRRRPRAVVVALPGHPTPAVTNVLPAALSFQLGRALSQLPSDDLDNVPARGWRPVPLGVTVEVQVGTTRHAGRVRVVRLRHGE